MKFFKDLFRNKKSFNNILAALCTGILLIIMSNTFFSVEKKESPSEEPIEIIHTAANSSYEDILEKKLEETLSMVEGVGKVKVMITLKNSEALVVKEDSETENSQNQDETTEGIKSGTAFSSSTKTVLVKGDEPFVINEIKPQIEGVIIVAEGGNDVVIKNSLINASIALLGVDINKIEVLKMK